MSLWSKTMPVSGKCALLLILASAAMATQAQTTAAPANIPIEDFFGNEKFSNALLSPDARYLAIRVTPVTGRMHLVVMELATQKLAAVASFADADIGNFRWVNDKRLVFDVTDRESGQGDIRYGPGLYAVDRDGKNLRQLVARNNHFIQSGHTELLPWNTFLLGSGGERDSDYVYVIQQKSFGPGDLEDVDLLKLNTVSGTYTHVGHPNGTKSWLLDQNGEARMISVSKDKSRIFYYRDVGGKDWNKLLEFDMYHAGKGVFSPAFFGPDGTFYVRARHGDKMALYTYDLAARKIADKPLFAIDGYDFGGAPIIADHKLLGISYENDSKGVWWFDDKMKVIQKAVDERLPSTINRISVASRAETPFVLVSAFSDVQPRTTMLFNTETNTLTMLGSAYPAIHAEQMSPKEMVHYQARDGLTIPAYLTLPLGRGGKNLPLVVLVHGGPYVRGVSWDWNPDVQFLASRGYAVLEPEYRGSTGFGDALFRAGWKQWGLKMQDDIADGAKWAIAQGYADARRICIAGASYGGYATLMGLINDGDLYKCGIDWAGVTDINLMYDGNWTAASDLSEEWKEYGMPVLVGDQVKDAVQLKATSPLENAARIKQPLLLAYGGADLRVPLYHGKKFYNAVKQTNPDVEWVVYDEEGHGWGLPKNRVDFWSRVEKFLDKNIGH
jgi:dienelactone hydrolase